MTMSRPSYALLLYLKHAYGESDESVCARWSENVVKKGSC